MSIEPGPRARIAASVVALVLGLVALTVAPTNAKPPRIISQWGCTIRALGAGTFASPVADGPWRWSGAGRVTCPDDAQWLVVTLSVVEDLPGGPDRIVARRKTVHWFPPGTDVLLGVDAGTCYPGGLPPPNPYYLRMKVHAREDGEAAWLLSRSRANPCGGLGGPITPQGTSAW